jgi:hypothetical protein
MKTNKILILITACTSLIITGCTEENAASNMEAEQETTAELRDYKEALEILQEGTEAEVLDIETGITYRVKRVIGGFNTLADIETLTTEDTNKLLATCGGDWNIKRRAIIITIGEEKTAASIAPFEHSGSEEKPYGEIIDNRSGSTGTGINLDSIRENGMTGVVDVYFYNSLTPGVNRVDERHQEMVLKAAAYEE